MKAFITLLKGINVGGHKKVPMTELRELLAKEGFKDVQTYIQSGNVILKSSKNANDIEKQIEDAIQSHFGFEVSVIVKTRAELQNILENCPFEQEAKEKSYFFMFNKIPTSESVKDAETITYQNETFVIKNDCLYFFSSAGFGKSKFNMNTLERKLKVIATARNYNTMLKLISLSEEK